MAVVCICAGMLLSGCGKADKYYEQGVKQAQEENYVQAAQSMQKAISRNDEKAEYYISYGMILNSLGEYDKALAQYSKAYQDTKNSIANTNNKQIYYGQAMAYYNRAEYDKSLECLENAQKLPNPAEIDGDILCLQGLVYEARGEQDTALEAYSGAIKKDAKNWDAYLKRGALEEKLGENDLAQKDYQMVISGDTRKEGAEKFEAYFSLYSLCDALEEEDVKEQIVGQILKNDSKSAFIQAQKGRIYLCQKDYANAGKYLRAAQKAGYAQAGYYLGSLMMQQNKIQEAEKYFQAFIKENGDPMLADAYNQLAGCAIQDKQYKKAAGYLEKGLQVPGASDRKTIWRNLIVVYEMQGEFKQAAGEAKEYLAVYPQDTAMKKEYRFIKTRITRKKTAAVAVTKSAVSVAE